MSETPKDPEIEGTQPVVTTFGELREFWEEEDVRPVEIPFEQELEAIPPEAMRTLREEFFSRLHDPDDEDKVNLADMVAEAAKLTRELLLACHGEKWRGKKTSPCYEAIAKTSLADIALRTLALMRNGGMSQETAIALVITNIEAADYEGLEVTRERDFEIFRAVRKAHESHLKELARMPRHEWSRDQAGKLLPVPLKDGLNTLFPLPGWKGAKRREEQRRHFKDFLIDYTLDEHPKVLAIYEKRAQHKEERLERLKRYKNIEEDEKRIEPLSTQEKWSLLSEMDKKQLGIEAEKRLKEMERSGISPVLFRAAILWVEIWREARIREVRTRASQSGHVAKRKKRAARE